MPKQEPSQLYEIKLEIDKNHEQQLVRDFNLEKKRTYSDTDICLVSEPGITEKIKEVGEQKKYYQISYDGDLFNIVGIVINDDQGDILEKKEIVKELHRSKDVYTWPELEVECAFDFIVEANGRIFFEVYSRDRDKIMVARDRLTERGYENFVTESYDRIL